MIIIFIVILFQLFLSNANNLHTITWFQVFQAITWFQVANTNYHHHYVVLVARIFLTLSRHFSLSFIASGRSSGLHPVVNNNNNSNNNNQVVLIARILLTLSHHPSAIILGKSSRWYLVSTKIGCLMAYQPFVGSFNAE